jgi:hypothetical protein
MADEKKTTTRKRSTKKATEAEPEVKQVEQSAPAADAAEPEQKPTERMYTEAEVQAMIASLLAKQKKPEEDVVRMYYAGVCSKDNEAELPGYGVIRPGQYLEIQKREFGGKFMSPQARKFIQKRRLLVLDGLDEAERRRWNCDYKRGEVLTENALDNLLDMPLKELETLFSLLCKEHKQFVARYINSIVDGAKRANKPCDSRITLPLLRALNDAGKTDFPEGIFAQTIEAVRAEL